MLASPKRVGPGYWLYGEWHIVYDPKRELVSKPVPIVGDTTWKEKDWRFYHEDADASGFGYDVADCLKQIKEYKNA